MIFEYEYKPVLEDFTSGAKFSLTAILKALENASNAHSDKAGDNVFTKTDKSKAWILTDWQIQIKEYPVYGDKIKIETWPETLKSPLVTKRNFLMYKNGELCAKCATQWILFDIVTGRPAKIDPALLDQYGTEDKTVFDSPRLEKIPSVSDYNNEARIFLRRSDIDFNNHVHNLCYMDFALEALPEELYKNCEFKFIRINYKAALTGQEQIVSRYSPVEDSHLVNICDSNGEIRASVFLK